MNGRNRGKNFLFSFLFIVVERIAVINSQVWPQGTYGLPKPVSGCPTTWQEGWRQQDLENTNSKSSFSTHLQSHMEATLNGGDVKRYFCVKDSTHVGETRAWPAGSYCVYKKNQQCPSGMKTQSGYIKWDDEDTKNKNSKYGTLPEGTYDQDTKIFYCCNDRGQWNDAIELPVDKPFYLLPFNSNNCQRVNGAISSLDYIVYDTEETQNHDDFSQGPRVFSDSNKGLPKIYYCYYEGCMHKSQKESGTISTTHFPDYQYCSWSITVNQGSVVSLTLTSINIPSCTGNYMNIYDGVDDNASLMMSLCGNNATSGVRLRTTTNNMFIILKSRLSSGNMHFQADYKTTTPFSGLSWPSGTYGLPKTTTPCPDMWIPGWRKQIMEDDKQPAETSLSTNLNMHMDVHLIGSALTRHFCTKTSDGTKDTTAWPAGNYCIYKKNQCPSGMKDGFIKWDDEDNPKSGSNARHGVLPDGEYGKHGGVPSDTKIFYCCNDQGAWSQSIELPIDEPFYLLPYQSGNCQRVKNALSTLEFITYDTEEDNNYDDFQNSYAYKTGYKRLPTVYYCYYKGCNNRYEGNNGGFGFHNYPDYQYCSWTITVEHGLVVFLRFSTLNISDCSENQLGIYDGIDSDSPILATYCGANATSGNTLLSTGNVVYVAFKSGRRGKSLGFQAQYESKTLITETSWPSGTYGLPKTTGSCSSGWVQGTRKQNMEQSGVFHGATSSQYDMDAILDKKKRSIARKFCMKTSNNGNSKMWPVGSYCIYKKNTCPNGMDEGSIKWDDADDKRNPDVEGVLPNGKYDDHSTKIDYCCRNQGNWYDPIELPVSVSFFLLPYTTKNCQRVKWAMSRLQYIIYQTEESQNQDYFTGSHVYAENINRNHYTPRTLYYCYYKGCNYQIDAESASYISVPISSDQDFKHCSWLLSVRYGNISVTFNTASVTDCAKGDLLRVYDGPNDKSNSLANICGTEYNHSITSTGKHLFVSVKSGYNRQMGTTVGFHASFKNNLPFSIIVSTPSMASHSTPPTTPASTPPTTPASTPKTTRASTPPTTPASTPKTTRASTPPTTPASTQPTKRTSTPPTARTSTPPTSQTSTPSKTLPATLPLTTPTTALKMTTSSKKRSTSASDTGATLTTQNSSAATKVPIDTDKTTHTEASRSKTMNTDKPTGINTPTTSKAGNQGGNSEHNDSPVSALVYVIPVCLTFLVTVIIVMLFYRRKKKDNPTQGAPNETIHPSSPEFNPRFQSPDKVFILGGQQVNIPSDEKENPLYETQEEHTYWSIEDTQKQYKKEIGNCPSKSTFYETPLDSGASTSSLNPYEISPVKAAKPSNIPPEDNTYDKPVDSLASMSSFNPLYSSESTNHEAPLLSDVPSTSHDTTEAYYKNPANPYNKLPKSDIYKTPSNVSQTDSGNQQAQTTYENFSLTDHNPHYQTPNNKPDTYEVMHGKLVVDLSEETGMTQC
ncbi:uncharacterized protein LOC114526459 [Dendronephthya gigantea]|uniref:uncharacterized protein LOC114526459 n=1 Tax=Dendronephthya gigantea TaxID=151771 RepID=UPI00106B77FC|nr:uncharacterized protein LOC114526459 [Dendronephthya gigantea]